MINPSRLVFARVRRQWTKRRLAQALGVADRTVFGYEAGEYPPEADKLEKMASLLQFPVEFFYGDDLPIISEHAASFRAMSKISTGLKNSAQNAGTIAFLFNEWIEKKFQLPEADLPDLSDLSPEVAAITLRRMWGLGEAPIHNMIHLLESKGIRVFSLAIDAKEVDAYSVWHEGKPFVFLNTFKSAERSRFDAAHELKHLVCDRHSMLHGGEHTQKMERDAQAFAAAFLMPDSQVLANMPNVPSLGNLIRAKKFFGVSLAAFASQLKNQNLLSEWVYRKICIDIAKNGFRTQEPEPMRREQSQILGKVLEALRAEGVRIPDVAKQLHVFASDLENLTFGLAMTNVSVAVAVTPPAALPRPERERPALRVIDGNSPAKNSLTLKQSQRVR